MALLGRNLTGVGVTGELLPHPIAWATSFKSSSKAENSAKMSTFGDL